METIRVNMTPCEDIKTIHASQNDNEAREWGFELHNNGEKIDSSSISDQLVFKAYKGGTEQILPTNGSTPTTSPFKGDIKYPQGLLSDQEFLYRESPTEEDGLAKIQTIYGNTLKWNQLIQNGNFADLSSWLFTDCATSVSDNTLTLTSSTTSQVANARQTGLNIPNGHKFIVLCDVKVSQPTFRIILRDSTTISNNFTDTLPLNTWYKYGKVEESRLDIDRVYIYPNRDGVSGATCELKNFMIFDLTAMLGSTKADEIYAMEQAQSGSGVAYFRSLFPLSYYDYNAGTLLSFNGTGLKTVGFNQWDEEWVRGYYNANTGALVINENTTIASKNHIKIVPNKQYYFNFPRAGVVFEYDSEGNFISRQMNIIGLYTPSQNTYSIAFHVANYGTSNSFNYNNDICVNISDTSKNGTYEPYTSSTLSLPISTYFSNGMKSAGSVYDELTEAKAITRIGSVDLGNITWLYNSSRQYFYSYSLQSVLKPIATSEMPNIICNGFVVDTANNIYAQRADKTIGYNQTQELWVRDSSYTDANTFKTAMSGVMLYYELATESETSFTTASLVTENAEIPLSNEDGALIGKCTEQLSSESGFFDAKIKLTDADGECYSNKIQLHIERSPQ